MRQEMRQNWRNFGVLSTNPVISKKEVINRTNNYSR